MHSVTTPPSSTLSSRHITLHVAQTTTLRLFASLPLLHPKRLLITKTEFLLVLVAVTMSNVTTFVWHDNNLSDSLKSTSHAWFSLLEIRVIYQRGGFCDQLGFKSNWLGGKRLLKLRCVFMFNINSF